MFRLLLVVAIIALASGLKLQKFQMPTLNKFMGAAVAGVFAANSLCMPANAISKQDLLSLSYEQVKGSGLANRCSDVTGSGSIQINGKKKITNLCLEPTSFQVEEVVGVSKGEAKKEFVNTKLMTRQTYSLEGVSGTLSTDGGKATFTEEDGIDYAATTVQLPGGERVPFLFSIKNLIAKSSSSGPIKAGFDLSGSFQVPSYRTGAFLDPKGRGTTSGYDFAQALPASNTGNDMQDKLAKENDKKFDLLKGDIEFVVNAVDQENGEIGGVFVSTQPSDTDMGSKTPKTILLKGKFFANVE